MKHVAPVREATMTFSKARVLPRCVRTSSPLRLLRTMGGVW